MKVVQLKANRARELLDFLSKYEETCVALVSEILQGARFVFIVEDNSNFIRGAFSFLKGAFIHHCFPDLLNATEENKNQRAELKSALSRFFKSRRTAKYLFNVTGEKSGTDLLGEIAEGEFQRKIMHTQNYFLMTLEDQNALLFSEGEGENETKNARFKLCTASEIDETLFLQIAYEKEEVIFENIIFDENLCRANLENLVEAQAVYLVELNGQIVSKASISSRGKKCAQIGGVFTKTRFRQKGLARFLMKNLIQKLKTENQKPVLFVKPENRAAMNLYDSCGFKKVCDFKSIYLSSK